jgi:hypothetical protein
MLPEACRNSLASCAKEKENVFLTYPGNLVLPSTSLADPKSDENGLPEGTETEPLP